MTPTTPSTEGRLDPESALIIRGAAIALGQLTGHPLDNPSAATDASAMIAWSDFVSDILSPAEIASDGFMIGWIIEWLYEWGSPD